MTKNRITVLFFVFLFAMITSACASEEQQGNAKEENAENEESPLQIYTTLFAWEDLAKKIGGEEVEVENVVPIGGDPHSFEPAPQTMIDIAEADAFIYNGLGIEGFADSVNDTAKEAGVYSIEVTSGIDVRHFNDEHDHSHEHHHDEEHEDNHGEEDPHIWLDPIRAREAAENIKDALIELRPESKDIFEKNFEALEEDLHTLDNEFSEMAASAKNKQFIVSHSAYGYWEDRYGLEQIGISGLAPSDEPSQKKLKSIIELVEDYGINHLMFEQNYSTKVTEVIQEEVGAEALYLHNLSILTEEESDAGVDYFSLMRENIDNLRIALQEADSQSEEQHHSHHTHNDHHDDAQ